MSHDLGERLTEIEANVEERPGAALDDLLEVIADLDRALKDSHERAHALIYNEDLAGGAQVLTESALILQRTARLSLALREEIRRRR